MRKNENRGGEKEALLLSNEEARAFTRECLRTALLVLMEEKPLEEISITELVARAGVSRSAFYRNYQRKEDVLEELNRILEKKLRAAIETKNVLGEFGWYRRIFEIIREHEIQFRLLLEAGLVATFYSTYSPLDEALAKLPLEERCRSIAFTGAITNLIMHWVKYGMKETEEEMARLCTELLHIGKDSKEREDG